MNDHRPFKNFTGDVDSLLEHCSKVDLSLVDNQDTLLNHEELIDTIMEDYKVTREEAEYFAFQIKLDIVRDTTKKLADEGILELVGYDEDGECVYKMTPAGEQIYGKMKPNQRL